ncbi:MAG: hypothetical protein A2Y82_00770 [Candidatus Buchananbacteria bacterium RBG_13_36_9]|uniref:Peptidase M10 metallopeptidase domain-containing protein n=1 Tax=Candidatus Buchananbacteria bacterium RBG_13_36_9 TaxID=1797530 RepID=A0A1G1XMS3_9BACT|nr:MAG: hypothetical protein A2Y82_00770 [Candidatus Buchananbacteria bacterium RBG_13_36_9]
MKPKYFLNIVLIFLLVGFFQPVLAQTNATDLGNCSYEIKVKIAFEFAQEISVTQSQELLVKWQDSINFVWNNNSAKYFNPGCRADYKFELSKLPAGQSCRNQDSIHCFKVMATEKNTRGNIADAQLVLANSGLKSKGEWTTATTGLNAAHEAGHLIGLKDEYHYNKVWINDNYQTSGQQSIMAQTWDKVSALAEHSSQILSKAGFTPVNLQAQENFINLKNLTSQYYSSPLQNKTIYLPAQEIVGALIKGKTDPAVYLVDKDGKLRHLVNEQVAASIAGNDWAKKIIYLDDSLVYTYQFGEPLY